MIRLKSHLWKMFFLQYKTERDGVVETRVEQKITIQSDGDPIDHDKALAEAIQVSYNRIDFNVLSSIVSS